MDRVLCRCKMSDVANTVWSYISDKGPLSSQLMLCSSIDSIFFHSCVSVHGSFQREKGNFNLSLKARWCEAAGLRGVKYRKGMWDAERKLDSSFEIQQWWHEIETEQAAQPSDTGRRRAERQCSITSNYRRIDLDEMGKNVGQRLTRFHRCLCTFIFRSVWTVLA